MYLVGVLSNLIWMVTGDKKAKAKCSELKAEMKLKDIDWGAFLDEKGTILAPEEVGAPNEQHISLLEADRAKVRAIRDETTKQIEDELPEIIGARTLGTNDIMMIHHPGLETTFSVDDKKSLSVKMNQAYPYFCEVPNADLFGTMANMYYAYDEIEDDIEKNIKIMQKGKNGEDAVSKALSIFQGKYRILENIVIPANDEMGETSETDVYIITDKGVFVCEVKNYGNENQILHIAQDGRWEICDIHNGRILSRKASATQQNARHCLATEG